MTGPASLLPARDGVDRPVALNGAAGPAIRPDVRQERVTTPTPEREQLLEKLAQDRRELVEVAGRLKGPVRTLEAAKTALVVTRRTIRWVALAGNVLSVAAWIRSGRGRPPLPVILGVTYELFHAWSQLGAAKKASRRPAAP